MSSIVNLNTLNLLNTSSIQRRSGISQSSLVGQVSMSSVINLNALNLSNTSLVQRRSNVSLGSSLNLTILNAKSINLVLNALNSILTVLNFIGNQTSQTLVLILTELSLASDSLS